MAAQPMRDCINAKMVIIFPLKLISNGFRQKTKPIFIPFNRLGAEHSEIEGTCIGLTISKWLIEAMNGEIGFDSEENKGCTFWIKIPKTNQHNPEVTNKTIQSLP